MNYGAYYPPGSNYGAASAYNRAYQAGNSYTLPGSIGYSQQATSGASNGKASASKDSNDQSILAGMQNMSLASK